MAVLAALLISPAPGATGPVDLIQCGSGGFHLGHAAYASCATSPLPRCFERRALFPTVERRRRVIGRTGAITPLYAQDITIHKKDNWNAHYEYAHYEETHRVNRR